MVEKQYDLFQISLEYNLNLFFRMNGFRQIGHDPAFLSSPHIGEQLIPHKKCGIRPGMHLFHSPQITFSSGFPGLIDIGSTYCIRKTFYAGLLVVR